MEINETFRPIDLQAILLHLRKMGFTEAEIATYIGTNQSTVSRILSGKVRRPRGQAVQKLQQMQSQFIRSM